MSEPRHTPPFCCVTLCIILLWEELRSVSTSFTVRHSASYIMWPQCCSHLSSLFDSHVVMRAHKKLQIISISISVTFYILCRNLLSRFSTVEISADKMPWPSSPIFVLGKWRRERIKSDKSDPLGYLKCQGKFQKVGWYTLSCWDHYSG